MGRPQEQLSQSQPQLIPETRQLHEQHDEINADLVWHAAMMRRYPSEISVQSSSSGSASTNTSFVDSKFTLVTLDRMDGHVLRRRKRIASAVYQHSSFFADDNSDSETRPSPKVKTSTWLIPADHPYKICWDLCTVLVSFIGAYNAHSSIRDRSFDQTPRLLFCECWFLVDMILNFLTQHKSFDGRVLRDGKSVWARYLTTWFVIDVLSLLPWEVVYVKPIIEMQNRLNWFAKLFKRSKAVVRVTRVLRGRHFKLFGRVAKQTKHAGVGARRLLRLLIKYVPKYIFFWRRMKGVVVVRLLRMLRYIQRILKNIPTTKREDEDTHTDVTQEECDELEEEDDSLDDLY
jgi:hypothetical protein